LEAPKFPFGGGSSRLGSELKKNLRRANRHSPIKEKKNSHSGLARTY